MHDYIEEYKENGFNGKSDNTKKTYIKEIELFNEWLIGAGTDISKFSRLDVQHYINYLAAKKIKAATINKKFRAIVHYCRFKNLEDIVKEIKVVKPENQLLIAPKALQRNEKNQLLREVSRNGSKRDNALIVFLLNTGIRVHECANLKLFNIEDISQKKGFIRIRGKGSKERTVPLNSDVRFALSEYLKERSIDLYNLNKLKQSELEEPLFLSNYNKPLSVRRMQDIVYKYGKAYPHTLRHTFATDLIRTQNTDPIMVAQLLGHSNLNTVQRYTKATNEEMLKTVENLTTN